MVEVNYIIITVFIIYLLFMMGIGLFFYFRTKNLSDYVLGGRSLNGWVTCLSAQASDMSGWLLLGLPGAAYLTGLNAIWIAIGLAVGTYLNWKFVAKRLRVYTELAGDALTLPDYFENRFKDSSKTLRVVSALFILIFFLFYTSSGFVAGGKLFSTVFNVSYIKALTIGAFVIVIYTFLGGFMAVCWTDFVQGIMMFLAVVLVPIIGVVQLGGIGEMGERLMQIDDSLLNPFLAGQSSIGFIAIVSALAWGLGYFGQPHILVRFMAIRSPKEIKNARRLAMVWVIFSLTAAILIGLVGKLYLVTPLVGNDSEKVFITMIGKMFHPIIAGILLSAVMAAVMSTADSQLLVTASSITEDFYKVLFRKDASQLELMWIGRVAVLIVAVIAYMIALDPESSVLDLVSYAWAGFGAAFGPTVIMSLCWKRMTRNGAIAGIISGGITVIVWKLLSGGIFDLYEIVPGIIVSTLIIIVTSLKGADVSGEIKEEFDKVVAVCEE